MFDKSVKMYAKEVSVYEDAFSLRLEDGKSEQSTEREKKGHQMLRWQKKRKETVLSRHYAKGEMSFRCARREGKGVKIP